MSKKPDSRKRDLVRRWFRNHDPLGETVFSSPAQPVQTIPDASNLSSFLEKALLALSPEDRTMIQSHIEPNIRSADTILQKVYDAALRQKVVCDDKKWRYKIGERTVLLHEKADRVLLWLEKLKSAGDSVAAIDPIHVGLPWMGIRLLLEMAITDSKQMAALLTGMDLALCLINRIQVYSEYLKCLQSMSKTTFVEQAVFNFEDAVTKLSTCLLQFLAAAISTYQKGFLSRTWRAVWDESAIDTFETKADSLALRTEIEANTCDRDLHVREREDAQIWKKEFDKKLRGLNAIQHVTESLAAMHLKVDLSKLSVAKGATYNSYADGQVECLEGTRTDLLLQITEWEEDLNGKNIFWLSGMAGTGKSTISRTVAAALYKKQRLGASFFFKRGEGDRGNASRFFPTIALQLGDIVAGPSLRQKIAEALEADSLLCEKSLQEQYEKLLKQPLANASADAQNARLLSTLVIVIDAMDECERPGDIALILRCLAELKIRAFVTSRPHVPIQLGFQRIDGHLHQDVKLEQVQPETIRRDIQRYLEHHLEIIRQNESLIHPLHPLPLDWPRDRVDDLVNLTQPLFIFAATVCRYMAGDPDTRLEIVIQQETSLTGIANLYAPILEQVVMDLDEEDPRQGLIRLQKLLKPLILLADPLPIEPLSRLIQIPPREIERILPHMQSVLHVPKSYNTDPVRLLHLSFRDFLVGKNGGKFRVDERNEHARLAEQCMERMESPGTLHNDLCSTGDPGVLREDVSEEDVMTHFPADLIYACRYWVWHTVHSCTGDIAPLGLRDRGTVHKFLEKHFLHWTEAMIWLNRFPEIIEHIDQLQNLVSVTHGVDLLEFLRDARRFLHRHREMVETAPMQLYYSALHFSPTNSVVRKIFLKDHGFGFFDLLPIVPQNWGAEMQKIQGHYGIINMVALSPDERMLASAGNDSTVRLWRVQNGEEIHRLKGNENEKFDAVTISPNGKMIAALCYTDIVYIWDVQTGEVIHRLTAMVEPPQITKDAHRRKIETIPERGSRQLESGDYSALAFSPNGSTISAVVTVSCYEDESVADEDIICKWDVQTGDQISFLRDFNFIASAAMFSPDLHTVALGSYHDHTIRLIDLEDGDDIHRLEGHTECIRAVAFSSKADMLASASTDRTLRLWKVATGKEVLKLEVGDSHTTSLAFSPDGKMVASTHFHEFCLWNSATGECIRKFRSNTDRVDWVTFSADGRMIASAFDTNIRLFDLNVEENRQEHDPVYGLAFSPDGQMVASASKINQSIRVWNVNTGKMVQELSKQHEAEDYLNYGADAMASNCVAFSADGGTVVWKGSQILRMWSVETGLELEPLRCHGEDYDNSFRVLVFSPVDKILATGTEEGVIGLWHTGTGRHIRELIGHLSDISTIAFSLDGKLLATGSGDDTVRLWDVDTGKDLHVFEGHTYRVCVVVFSPDRETVASGAGDNTIRLWNVKTGQILRKLDGQFDGHSNSFYGISFFPAGAFIAATWCGSQIYLWNARTGEELTRIKTPGGIREIWYSDCFLNTDSGSFRIQEQASSSSQTLPINEHLTTNGIWIRCHGRNILWLPHDHREASVYADRITISFGNTIAIGHTSGNVSFFRYNPSAKARADGSSSQAD